VKELQQALSNLKIKRKKPSRPRLSSRMDQP
jgi:hypothetical protein